MIWWNNEFDKICCLLQEQVSCHQPYYRLHKTEQQKQK